MAVCKSLKSFFGFCFCFMIIIPFYLNANGFSEYLSKFDPLLQRCYRLLEEDHRSAEIFSPVLIISEDDEISLRITCLYSAPFQRLSENYREPVRLTDNIATITVTSEDLEKLLLDQHLIRAEIYPEDILLLETSTSIQTLPGPIYLGNWADAAQTGTNPFDGSGVIAAVIDPYGVFFQHWDFRESNGDSRIIYLWDQTTGIEGSNHPDGFDYGTEYTNSEINSGNCNQIPGHHGNSCLGILAGDGSSSPAGTDYTGMAPEAEIIYVKSDQRFSSYLEDGISYIFSQASQLNKPAVVSISLGNQYGAHDGTSLRVQAIDSMCEDGRQVVFACGNSGAKRIHAETYLSTNNNHTFEINSSSSYLGVDIWFSGTDTISVSLKSPNLPETETVHFGQTYVDATADGIIEIYNCTDIPTNGDHHIVIYAGENDGLFANGIWQIELHADHISSRNGLVDAWSFSYDQFTAASGGNTSKTLNELASGHNTVAAAGFLGGSVTGFTTGTLYSGSGRGPTRDGRQKPDLAGNQGVYVPSYTVNNGYIATGYGTSYSAPHVAGAIALMLQKNNLLSPTAVLTDLHTSAFRDIYTTAAGTEPNYRIGYGKLNTLGSLDEPLPLILSSFTAFYDNSVNLIWTTISESGLSGWNIYRNDSPEVEQGIQINQTLIPAGNSSQSQTYYYSDQDVLPVGSWQWYVLEAVWVSGETQLFSPVAILIPDQENPPDDPVPPKENLILNNFPNPFNPGTDIFFSINNVDEADLSIFDLRGRKYFEKNYTQGDHHLFWQENELDSGIFFCRLKSANTQKIIKMVHIK
ncbi:MAG: S8 family peptidase [Candidatus Cloacimonetes bacterium]|nr:S8 family peptidase [Candidatus Cloacimonadota bacterium]